MFIIAHRGASKQRTENTIEAFEYAAEHGAGAVEMDVRLTADGVFVIYHDDEIDVGGGTLRPVWDVPYAELLERVSARGTHGLLTLRELTDRYRRDTPVLFHVKLREGEQRLIEELKSLKPSFFLGAVNSRAAAIFSQRFGRERVLAFMPEKELEDEFLSAGAGIIRLWEQWLAPGDVERIHRKGAQVWIMTNNPDGVGETDEASVRKIAESGADGLLLNDIHIARHVFG